jgi:hypothetical protein
MRFAVLTGDFVDSTDLAPATLDAAMAELASAAADVAGGRAEAPVAAHFARRGGDGWQVALDRPALWLRVSLYLRARLRQAARDSAPTRIAIATGQGALPDDHDPNAAHGAAFTASGRLLEALPAALLMSHAGGGAETASAVLADTLSQGWTRTQARTLCALLPPAPPTHAEVAERLGVSRQAVDQSARAAGLPALTAAMSAIEEAGR